MPTNKNNSLTIELIYTNGKLNRRASEQAFHELLASHATELEMQEESIGKAVLAIFSESKGNGIPLPQMANMVVARLNAPIASWGRISEKVMDYCRANTQGKTDAKGIEEFPESLFVLTRGPGGGLHLRTDMIVETPETQEQKEEAPKTELQTAAPAPKRAYSNSTTVHRKPSVAQA